MRARGCTHMLCSMAIFSSVLLGVHITAGALALLVFWIPLVTTKGGRMHRRAGFVYTLAAGTVAATGLVACVRLAVDGRWRAAIFLAYVGVFAAESAFLGLRALRSKERNGEKRSVAERAFD